MKRIFALLFFLSVFPVFALPFNHQEIEILTQNFLANITPEGAIMASPREKEPDYYYDWVRDSAIAMDLIERWYEQFHRPEDKLRLQQYVRWTERIEQQEASSPAMDILGEPKFHLPDSDNPAQVYMGNWGRPQNDGPAIRALTLIHFAESLLKENDINYVEQHLYKPSLNPAEMGLIKKDLEYIAHHWSDKNFDLWEEAFGDHFFNAMMQRKALFDGIKLAQQMNDPEAASYYAHQIERIEQRLKMHIDVKNETIMATLLPHLGPQKPKELDSAILLAVLMGNNGDHFFAPNNILVKNTVAALTEEFKKIYPINREEDGAVLFGRYIGDTYDGYRTDSIGNPWFILTATMAEYYYTLARDYSAPAQQKLFHHYIDLGDNYLKLIKKYGPNLRLAEQIHLETGIPQGASSLTWSYVAVLRAIEARNQLKC